MRRTDGRPAAPRAGRRELSPSLWQRLIRWLYSTPVADPIDRRNAAMLQVLLLVYGVALPVNWAWHLHGRDIPPGWGIVVLLDMLTCVLAVGCVVMIRRGLFRTATRMFLASILFTQAVVYHRLGTYAQLDQTALILTLVLSGLVLGRGTLWTTYAAVQVIYLIGWFTDASNPDASPAWIREVLKNAPSLLLSSGLITFVIDRTVAAMRSALAESDARGRELQREIAQRERTQAQLIHAQKLEATGRLASGIAHDFNNVLELVLGFARQRDREDGDTPQARIEALQASLEGTEAAARRGIDLTRKLLGFSRNDLLKIETFDAGQAARELQPMLRQLFPPSVRIHLHNSGPAPVRMDRSEFELMILNLATNARDAMPDGGTFSIEVHRPPGDTVQAILSDSGHGMDARTMRRIFEPFFSTKDAGEGTGLGLSVIRDLVRAGGGDITVESTPGAGTAFTIRLPIADSGDATP